MLRITAAIFTSDELSTAIQNCEVSKLTFRIFFVVFPFNRNPVILRDYYTSYGPSSKVSSFPFLISLRQKGKGTDDAVIKLEDQKVCI